MNSAQLGKEMIDKLMILIERIRSEKLIKSDPNMALLKNIIEMIRELEEYSQGELEFENVFIKRTWTFYEKESLAEFKKFNRLPEYLKYAWERLTYESDVICSVLAPITRDKLMKCVRERLILDQMNNLFPKPLGSSLRELFNASDRESLKLLYGMVNGVFGVERLASEWASFIRVHGQELIGKGNDYKTIEGIAKFKDEIDSMIKECFLSDPVIQGTLKDSFESVMNGRGERSAELLALYIHHKLQSGAVEEPEAFLSTSLLLFRYLHCKEAFDGFYKRTLAQRLLFHGGSGIKDLNLERQFIAKLREECGGGFVSRMESMLKDVEQSYELTKSFKSSDPQLTSGISGVTGITVISGLWPCGSQGKTMSMPSELVRLEGSFGQFYLGQKKNCTLKWAEHLGSCVMRSTFKSGPYNLNLTIPQALVLLKFNTDNTTIPLSKLIKEIHMDRELLEETLASLSSPIYPIILNTSAGYVINEEFEFNGTGKVPLYALQSPFLPVEEEIIGTMTDDKFVDNSGSAGSSNVPAVSVIVDRQYQVDSLLVRRMKHQHRCPRKDLINYALSNLENVRVSASDVDGRIDGLIEKEFMKMEDDYIVYLP